MRALTYQSVAAVDRYALIASFLTRHREVFAKHGVENPRLFLAEPVMDERSGFIDWYAEGTGPAKKLADMTEAEQAPVKAGLQAFAQSVSAVMADGEIKDSAGLELVRLALNHPSPTDDIWAVDGHPVLINWGFAPSALGRAPEDIMRLGLGGARPTAQKAAPQAAAPVPPAAVPAAAPAAKYFPGCLLPLLLALLLLWLLLSALGWLPSPLPSSCFRQDAPDTASERMRAEKLLSDRDRLLDELAKRAALCRPAVTEKQAEPEREAVIPQEPVTPKPEAKPEEKAETPFFGSTEKPAETPEPKKDEALKIPDTAADNKDMAFLNGCWRSETELKNDSGEKIVGEYCFNKKGRGTRSIYEKNGRKCTGPATAKFSGKKLQIESDYAECGNGGRYVPQQIQCTGSGDTTHCSGQEITPKGRGNRWDAGFRRK